MQHSEFLQLQADGIDLGIDPSLTVSSFNGGCAVDDLIALRLSSVSPKFAPGSSIPIIKDDSSTPLADLVVCEHQEFGYGAASAHHAAAYLNEISTENCLSNGIPRRDYVFKHSYLIVNIADFNEYHQMYRKGSGIWGMFVHSEEQASPLSPYRSTAPAILASPNVKFNGDLLNDLVFRAVSYDSPLERFLKLYHLLEINFDVQLVDAIKALNQDLRGMGKILKTFNANNEFDRLLKLIRSASSSSTFFEKILQNIFSNPVYLPTLIEMLFEYEKDANPYSKVELTSWPTILGGGFVLSTLTAAKLNTNYEHLSKFTAYIIYRFRCSIAHAKIGEFVLTTDDEALICDVAEPAIIAILVSSYK